MEDIYETILKLRTNGECAALATLISTSGSTPREQGAKMLIKQDGSIIGTVGGSLLEGRVREEAKNVIRDGKPNIIQFDLTGKDKDGMICGGKAEIYIEPIIPKSALYIFGGGHISFFLARIGKMLDFRVVVIDDREEYSNPERFPDVDKTIADEYANVCAQISADSSSYLVLVTRSHAYDQTVLQWAVSTNARYIGMIGSRKKIKKIYNNLIGMGVSDEDLKRVHAPIGLSINAETPQEIAVSIIAEIIKIRRSEGPKGESVCPL
jgi:xanthine dehydrogenase accessory factor